MRTLVTILGDKWSQRWQILRLARFDLIKMSKDSILSWAWIVLKPLIMIFCYWFALYVGFRHAQSADGLPPYILWLVVGVVPWNFMSTMLGKGTDTFHSYSYLVTKVPFPLAAVPSVHTTGSFIVQLALLPISFVTYFACGMDWDIHLLQVPFLLVLMYAFWDVLSLLCSLLSAVNRGVANFIGSLGTPIFWLSGVITDLENTNSEVLRHILYFNPVTFFISAFRKAFYYQTWVWSNPEQLVGFAIAFGIVVVMAVIAYRRLAEEVPDVL